MIDLKHTIVIVMALSGMLLLSSCQGDKHEVGSETQGPAVQTSVASLTAVPKSYRFTGTVEGEHRINLSTKVMGRITELPFDLGDAVSKGEVLLRIKNDNIVAQRDQVAANLAEAQASLKNTRTNYKRIKALFADSSATQKELDDISTQLGVAEARVKALKSKQAEVKDLMDYSVIESPIDGYVVQKNVSSGDMASPGQPLLSVEEVADLKVMVSVPASQIDLFSRGDTLEVSINAAKEHFLGTVKSINPSADPMSRQFEVELSIPKETAGREVVKPGMFADVDLLKGKDSLLMVPESALVRRGQLTGLYTVNDNHELLLRWVRTGRKRDGNVEILSGLKPGERIVLAGDRKLVEGQKVTIQ
jgi:RND family efflux transporter MFP subunit